MFLQTDITLPIGRNARTPYERSSGFMFEGVGIASMLFAEERSEKSVLLFLAIGRGLLRCLVGSLVRLCVLCWLGGVLRLFGSGSRLLCGSGCFG